MLQIYFVNSGTQGQNMLIALLLILSTAILALTLKDKFLKALTTLVINAWRH